MRHCSALPPTPRTGPLYALMIAVLPSGWLESSGQGADGIVRGPAPADLRSPRRRTGRSAPGRSEALNLTMLGLVLLHAIPPHLNITSSTATTCSPHVAGLERNE